MGKMKIILSRFFGALSYLVFSGGHISVLIAISYGIYVIYENSLVNGLLIIAGALAAGVFIPVISSLLHFVSQWLSPPEEAGTVVSDQFIETTNKDDDKISPDVEEWLKITKNETAKRDD